MPRSALIAEPAAPAASAACALEPVEDNRPQAVLHRSGRKKATVMQTREHLLTRLGFRFGTNGSHAARTMMLGDLALLFERLPADAGRADPAREIVESNVLGKPTRKARERAQLNDGGWTCLASCASCSGRCFTRVADYEGPNMRSRAERSGEMVDSILDVQERPGQSSSA